MKNNRKIAVGAVIIVAVVVASLWLVTSLPWGAIFANTIYLFITFGLFIALLLGALLLLRRAGRRNRR